MCAAIAYLERESRRDLEREREWDSRLDLERVRERESRFTERERVRERVCDLDLDLDKSRDLLHHENWMEKQTNE